MSTLYILAIGLWILGYLVTARATPKKEVENDFDRIVFPPAWLYLICGAPKIRGYPRGTISVGAIRLQLWGLALGIYIATAGLWEPSRIEFYLGFASCLAISVVITSYISKHYVATKRALKRKSKM